jgi:spermidine/putrescine transport system substrate-binding protein
MNEFDHLTSAERAEVRRVLTRRSFLARGGAAILGASTLGSATAAVAKAQVTGPVAATGTVRLLCWQGYDDAKAAKPLTSTGVKIAPTYITNNDEIVAKLRAGGVDSFDIVTPYFGYIGPLVEANLLQPIDYSRVPNTKTFFKQFLHPTWNTFGGKTYSVPLVWGDTPMIIRPDLFKSVPQSWLDLRDKRYKGQLTTLDDPLGNILIYSKVLYGGAHSTRLTQKELDDVMKVWREVKRNLVNIAPSFGDIADMLTRGDAYACVEGWRFLEVQIKGKGKPASAHLPKEGTFGWCDNYCIPREAPNVDGAYAFINTMVSARGDAILGADTGSATTNSASVAKLPAEQRKLYPYTSITKYLTKTAALYGLPPLKPEGNIVSFPDWLKAWQELKSA